MIEIVAHEATLGGIVITGKIESTPVVGDVIQTRIKIILDFDPFKFPCP